MTKGLIFNIQRYSVHDGSGIRTLVFLKGCPLKCPWCSNPESQGGVEPVTWLKDGKKEIVGEWKTVEEVTKEVLKDEMFYRTSSGGVTISGGEALIQKDFVLALLQELKSHGIHTAIETTGCTQPKVLASLLPYLDQVLFDLKIMNQDKLKRTIGAALANVKDNFRLVAADNRIELIARVPLIPQYTTDKKNIAEIISFLSECKVAKVHLLPFHQYGSNKYEYLGQKYSMSEVDTLKQSEIEEIVKLFKAKKIIPTVEGLA